MIEIEGVPVRKVVYAPNPATLDHARFAVSNRGRAVVEVAVRSVAVQTGATFEDVGEYFVYRLPDYDEVDPERILSEPDTTTEFEVSFEGREVSAHAPDGWPVAIELAARDAVTSVVSPCRFVTRKRAI